MLRGNRLVWWMAAAVIALQLLFCYAPIAHRLFGSASIGPREWLLTAILAAVIFLLTEVTNWVTRLRTQALVL